MEPLPFLTKGILLGLSIAIPVGPIGLLCIRRTLAQGQLMGLASGLGAATADGLYGLVGAFGLTLVADLLVDQTGWLRLIGGLFLCYLGITTFLAKPAEAAANVTSRGLFGAYASTFALTLTNPATILSFIAIFAGLGIAESGSGRFGASLTVIGVFLGSALWWVLLSWGVNLFRTSFSPKRLRWLNRLAGVAIFAFGIVALTVR
ncbi:LysE family transporter [Pseudanabaena sp. FACHB-2040]|uniref:LysE/ArgO family amino acid transporter n=1 Tax=Pseudanabaena sp. FACHB-2040 TaxID=2692859 RepID=UPI00168686FE|nr:LysE family transporter [Pseudanabaena sp. FACHB-2040]MBD2260022.1 LysE family transporter [Pseudanabaena sp. FACHB-2040]